MISKRLGIPWSLADKWKAMAQDALECGIDGCPMPTWSAVPTASQLRQQSTGVVTPTSSAGGDAAPAVDRPRFREVLQSAGASTKLLGKWAKGKGVSAASAVMPAPVKKAVVRAMANRIAKDA